MGPMEDPESQIRLIVTLKTATRTEKIVIPYTNRVGPEKHFTAGSIGVAPRPPRRRDPGVDLRSGVVRLLGGVDARDGHVRAMGIHGGRGCCVWLVGCDEPNRALEI